MCPGPAVLQFDHGFLRALRDETVPASDRMHGKLTLLEVLSDRRLQLVAVQRESAFRKDAISSWSVGRRS